MMRCAFALSLSLAVPAGAAELSQIPAIVAGKKAKGVDWRLPLNGEDRLAAAKKAGHNLTALGGDAERRRWRVKATLIVWRRSLQVSQATPS